jgi:hypothetical protein
MNFGYRTTFQLIDKGNIEVFGPAGISFNLQPLSKKPCWPTVWICIKLRFDSNVGRITRFVWFPIYFVGEQRIVT